MINEDTICAIATVLGGALGVVRVSGPEAITIVDKVFSPKGKTSLTQAKANTLRYGVLHALNGHEIDDVVVSLWRAPHSYTGEDAVEISCHGSAYIARSIVQMLIEAGCRQADHGEFTMRAFLNNKMDLSQAEAVADLIAANNKASHDLALSQMRGHFSDELKQLHDHLLKLTSLLELELDFSDHEDLEFADRTELHDLALRIDRRITHLADSFKAGQAIKEGIPVAIVGRTNVGKSTLLNQLLHEDKAIVSDIDGTTRDLVEDVMTINGVKFRIIDTAGIRQTEDKIERIGIERSYEAIAQAAIVVWVIDEKPTAEEAADIKSRLRHFRSSDGVGEQPMTNGLSTENSSAQVPSSSQVLSDNSSAELIIVHNKCDLHPGLLCEGELPISAKNGTNLDQLEQRIYEAAHLPEIDDNAIVVTNLRHYEALIRAHASLSRFLDGMAAGLPSDLLAEDLRLCLSDLGEITGQITPEATLQNIFKNFCIGK
jgi:tRNA modification GTPase